MSSWAAAFLRSYSPLTIQGQAIRDLRMAAPLAPPLPREIAFLVQHGVPAATLRRAAGLAAQAGVTADEALLKHGLVDEDLFYRALAAEAGLPFLGGEVEAGDGTRFPASILAGIVSLGRSHAPARIAVAPRGPDVLRLIDRRLPRAGNLRAGGLAVTTPSCLRRSVFRARAPAIAAAASLALPNARPMQSYHGGASHRQLAALLAGMGVVSFLLTHMPHRTLTVIAFLLAPIFLGMVVLRLAAISERIEVTPARLPRRQADRSLPVYTVIVPLYRETRVLEDLIAAIERLDYPAAKLDVKLVIEADDAGMAQALNGMRLSGFLEVVVAPPGRPRTKPRALNVALPLARGEYTVIYDAEDVPEPGQLRLAVATFARLAPDVACLQARLVIDNTEDCWLTRGIR